MAPGLAAARRGKPSVVSDAGRVTASLTAQLIRRADACLAQDQSARQQ